ncbi:ABC transporter substrate-binding protein [Paenibacillus alkalitolerans]|uniref:ABC transporter substrate-binding protein n=1 Tax=Paenibacillus alkalitolerans TaxID=2799335 RepID=UPI0018F56A94|nr:ABC transporter substrate binding protein [Paenibacillus alkalitolerans]
MGKYKIRSLVTFLVILACVVITSGCLGIQQAQRDLSAAKQSQDTNKPDSGKAFKILHVMSYHTPWEWTETQLQGFKDALGSANIEYKVFEMDTKNFSAEEQKREKAKQARELIESWKPDLLYASDDDAQEYVARHYAGTSLPIVFSAVNKEPETYDYTTAPNVTGVVEHEHFAESVRLLKEFVPDVRKIAVIFDEDPMWVSVEKRMNETIPQLEDVEFVSWDRLNSFEAYQNRIKQLQTEVDAIALIGIFTFKDEAGENVHYREVLKWTAENSNIPDFSFWKDRVSFGTLAVVSVSGYEQGYEAGLLARRILIDGKTPGSLPIRSSMKGEPLINKARADDLGIRINSKTLLSSKIATKYEWESTNE